MAYQGTKLYKFEPRDKVDELEFVDTDIGTGKVADATATITVHYTGALAKNGIVFQSTHDAGKAASFTLDEVIEGWKIGIPGMKAGGSRRIVIPARFAYGTESPTKNIPANSDLVFDIDLISVR